MKINLKTITITSYFYKTNEKFTSFYRYFKKLIYYAIDCNKNKETNINNTIDLHTENNILFDMKLTPDKKKELIDSGYNLTKKIC